MDTVENAQAKCPFYISAKGERVTCESGARSLQLRFPSIPARLEYMQRYCFNIQEALPVDGRCPFYCIALKAWEEQRLIM